jgi:acetoin utilization protein AcuB
MRNPTVERFMTRAPYTIGHDQPLARAHALMNEHGIRHLPVLEGRKLVGVVSQRDLHFLETLQDVDPEVVTVSEAMSVDAYVVSTRATIRRVASTMAERKLGSAVVVDARERVIGVFTTIDALRALAELIDEQRREAS